MRITRSGRGAVDDNIVVKVPVACKGLVESITRLADAVAAQTKSMQAGGEAVDYHLAWEQETARLTAAVECAAHGCTLSALEVDGPRVEIAGETYARVGHGTGNYRGVAGPVEIPRALYRKLGERNAPVVDAIGLRAGVIGDGWLPMAARAMAHDLQKGTSREAEQGARETGRLPYSRASFERVPHEVGALYVEHRADIEDQLMRDLKIPTNACSVSVSLDRASLPMEEPIKRPPGRPRKDAPKIKRVFHMAYCGTVTLHNAKGKALYTIRFGQMPGLDPVSLCGAMANAVFRLREKQPALALSLLAISSPATVSQGTFPPDIVTSIQYPGDAVVVVREQCALVCGAKDLVSGVSLSGVVLTLAPNASGEFVMVGFEYVEPGTQFVGAAYCATTSELFLLDAANKKIVKAAYTPGDAAPTTWTTAVTEAQFPPLADMSEYSWAVEVDAATPILAVAPWVGDLFPPEMDDESPFRDYYHVTLTATPTFATFPSYRDKQVLLTRIDSEDLRDAATSINGKGLPGESVNILRVDGQTTIEGSGIIGVTGSTQITVPALVMGGVYVARHAAKTEDSPPYFIPLKRFGASDALADGLTLTKFSDEHAHESFVNNPRFNLTMEVDVVDQSQVIIDKTYTAALIIGSESDIVAINGKDELIGPYLIWTDFTSTEVESSAMIAVDLPIPDTPALAGTTYCYQYLVDLGAGGVKSSDILCMIARADEYMPAGAAPFFPPAPAFAMSSSSRTNKVARSQLSNLAFQAWMSSCGAKLIQASPKAIALLNRLRFQKK